MRRQDTLLLAAALALAIAGASSTAADGAGTTTVAAMGAAAAGAGPDASSGGAGSGSTGAVATAAAAASLPAAATIARGPAAALPTASADTLDLARDAVDVTRLSALAPGLDVDVLTLALKAMRCAQRGGIAPAATRLAVIDYSLSSRQERLWVFDLAQGALLMHEPVAHGKNSGEDMTTSFSNVEGSLQTSLGLFVTGETYMGGNGYSLRMNGLEPGFNDQAMARAIVMHGAPYVDLDMARKTGRLGRSWGCPAVRDEIAREMIDTLKGGQFIFSYYPDDAWKTRSALINCAG
jgi:hypothetical protein